MKWLLSDVLILVSMTILISILTSNIDAVEYTFSNVPMTKKLPVWLSYVHTNATADKHFADGMAKRLMNDYMNAITKPTDPSTFRTDEAKQRFFQAFEAVNDNNMDIPDGVAELVNRAMNAGDCARAAFSISTMTADHTIHSEEEKVMIWTMIRIMAYYMFNNHKEFGALINATAGTPVLEMNFNLPDTTLIPTYYLMREVNARSHWDECKTEKPLTSL